MLLILLGFGCGAGNVRAAQKRERSASTVSPQSISDQGTRPSSQQDIRADVKIVNPPQKDLFDKAVFWINLGLAAIGAFGIGIGILSLNKLERQTKATEDAAKASLRQIEHLLASERAWLLVELTCPTNCSLLGYDEDGQHITYLNSVQLRCTNVGNSPAWVKEKSARLGKFAKGELPINPQLTGEDVLSRTPEPIGPGKDSVFKWDASGRGSHSPFGAATILYGVVKYQDVFRENRETWFCYQLTGDAAHRELIRINAPPNYTTYT
jgi:hypothetical protein